MRFLLVLLLLLSPAVAHAQFVRAEGKRFVTPDGATLHIRGINLGNWLMQEGYMFKFTRSKSPRQIDAVVARVLGRDGADAFWREFRSQYVTEADIRFIASAGFNTVRVPLHYNLFMPGDRFAGEGYRLLDNVIAWAKAANLRVIIDLHAAPGGQTGINHDDGPGIPLMFYVPAHRRATVALWRDLAARYRDEPAVLGYDLLNEPIAPYHDQDTLNPRLEPMYRELVSAIRAVDANHIIFLAGAQWSTTFEALGPPFAKNLAYTYHKFWSSTERDAVQPYLDFSNLYNVPILLGETGELDDDWNRRFRTLNEKHGIGWSFWTYKNLDTPSTVVSVKRPANWGLITKLAAKLPDEWTPADQPPAAAAKQALADYLVNIRFENGVVRRTYLESLGLAAK